ncbi:hypothetical protein EXW50_11525 [Bacillus mycoides]|nr:hypothetical protein EXW50_11525 [Bacillus mycoides]
MLLVEIKYKDGVIYNKWWYDRRRGEIMDLKSNAEMFREFKALNDDEKLMVFMNIMLHLDLQKSPLIKEVYEFMEAVKTAQK